MEKDVSPYVLSFTEYTSAQCASRTNIDENQCNTQCSVVLLLEWPIVECFEKFMRCIESYNVVKSTLHYSKRSIIVLAIEMSGSDRKRSSKWDFRDEPEFAPESKQLQSGWSATEVAGSNSSKWSYLEGSDISKPGMRFSSKEPFSGGRGSNKDDTSKDYRGLDASMESDIDGRYNKRVSPGFEEPKHKRRSPSPKNGRSSRSRSPSHGFGWDSGVNDKSRMRAGASTQACRDFASGKCRRGSRCHFLHQDNQNHEDSWDNKRREDGAPRYSTLHESRDHYKSGRSNEACINFAKGRCRVGASCKFVHHNNADGHGKVSGDELTREREMDRRNRDSFEQGGGHGPNRSGNTPCKFFASGNCRNGKYCRFSHDRQVSTSPNRRSRDDRWASNLGGDYQMLDRPKLTDSTSPNRRLRGDWWDSDGNKADAGKFGDSPKRNDAVVSDTAKLVDDKSENMDTTEPVFTGWPTSDGWGHGLHKSRVQGSPPFPSGKKETDHLIAGNTSANTHRSHSIGTEIWSGDAKMSPDWDYRVGSSSHIQEEHGQKKHGITEAQGFNQNAQSLNPLLSSSCQAVGQSPMAVPIHPSRAGIVDGMGNQDASTEKKYTAEPNIMDSGLSQVSSRSTPTHDMVGKEQLTNLSASLAHILGPGQQLPQFHSAFNSHDEKDTPTLANTEVPAMHVPRTFIKPDPAVGLPKWYDSMCDSIEPNSAVASGLPPEIPPSKKIAEDKVEILSQLSNPERQNSGDLSKATCSKELVKKDHLIQLQQCQKTDMNKDNKEVVTDDRKNSQDKINTKETVPLQNMDQNGDPDEAKKSKDMKGSRAFKYALVEFIKELLKPTWKEGQITKEDYKTIVKKVVDKVTSTMQGAHIPQTQDKIDHYLSFSKPKLNKLVQAYVEKVQKA